MVEAACTENTRTHTHKLPTSLSDMPNNDLSPLSLFLPLVSAPPSPSPLSLPRLSPSPPSLHLSVGRALRYHPNHYLIFTNGIPIELRDVSLRIRN